MRNYRRQNRRRTRLAVRFYRLRAFHNAPAIVAAPFDAINHFPQLPTDICQPQRAGLPIETHPPRVAEAVGPDFGTRAGRVHERIVGRYAVGLPVLFVINIDAEDRGKQVADVLARVERVGRIGRSGVAR